MAKVRCAYVGSIRDEILKLQYLMKTLLNSNVVNAGLLNTYFERIFTVGNLNSVPTALSNVLKNSDQTLITFVLQKILSMIN